jgi:hypothetical protein
VTQDGTGQLSIRMPEPSQQLSVGRFYSDQNVYEAAQERLDFIFKHFKRIYVSFSGEKIAACCLISLLITSGSMG